ncbi:MAG: fructose-6-phosphate aldolase [Erysipelotrichaceae bacterium]|nr:fructose-6-phosphate aldolase [Erysipelotrichaceae bacterium]
MKLLIDDANLDYIKKICEFYPIDGVTTNPSILAKTKEDPYVVLKKIREFIGPDKQLHVQVIATDAETMFKEGKRITEELGENTYIKIPANPEGFKAMRLCKEAGLKVMGTAIYSKMQAYLSAKSGADYIAPYVNRIDNLGYDGVETVKGMQDLFENNGYSTQVLAASFKNSNQVLQLCEYGIGAATVACDIIEKFVDDNNVSKAIDAFTKDFEGLVGKGKDMSNI